MPTIKIDNLNPVGSDFFNDSESYLNELTDDEMNINGGGWSYGQSMGISVSQGRSISATGFSFSVGRSVSYVASYSTRFRF